MKNENININSSIFPKLILPDKPRSLRQTWIKDVGFHEAPHYLERMGLIELIDFLETTSDRIDYVKFTTPQVIYSPDEWIQKKIKAYKNENVIPFLDHTYFKYAYKNNIVEKAIEYGKNLGFDSMEFMNTGDDVSKKQWKNRNSTMGKRCCFKHGKNSKR